MALEADLKVLPLSETILTGTAEKLLIKLINVRVYSGLEPDQDEQL